MNRHNLVMKDWLMYIDMHWAHCQFLSESHVLNCEYCITSKDFCVLSHKFLALASCKSAQVKRSKITIQVPYVHVKRYRYCPTVYESCSWSWSLSPASQLCNWVISPLVCYRYFLFGQGQIHSFGASISTGTVASTDLREGCNYLT